MEKVLPKAAQQIGQDKNIDREAFPLLGMLKDRLRRTGPDKAEPKRGVQKIKFTYNNYDQIFTEPVQLESKVQGQTVSVEQPGRELSEDFFSGLERIRTKGSHDLQITLAFADEKRNRDTENEIRFLYRKNYEDDIATTGRTLVEYKKRSMLHYSASGGFILLSGILLFMGVPERFDASQGTVQNAARAVEDLFFVAADLFLFLYAFSGWHLGKDKPEEMHEKMKEDKRYLNAKLTIITGDEARRREKPTEPNVAREPGREQA